jgi:hypothetical protein
MKKKFRMKKKNMKKEELQVTKKEKGRTKKK